MNSLIWILTGALILSSVWLSQVLSQWWLLLTFFVSTHLLISGITGYCPIRNYLRKQPSEAENNEDEF
ncbi:MAG: DUF2892 domain-containing protein [Verrucomicrobiota bacterium]